MGDVNWGGGVHGFPHPNILANGRPALIAGSMSTPHPHGPFIFPGFAIPSPGMVLFNGVPAVHMGDFETCGHSIITGSFTTLALWGYYAKTYRQFRINFQ